MKKFRSVFWLALATLVVAGTTDVLVRQLHSWQAGAVPFTAIRVITSYDSVSREVKETRHEVLAVRGDGSSAEVLVRVAPDGRQMEQRRIVDVAARKRVAVDGLTDSLTTYPLSEGTTQHYAFKRLPGCIQGSPPDKNEILDFAVELRNREIDDGGTLIRFEEWLAPELNCMIMKRIVRIGQADGSFPVTSTEEITSLTRGEPDPSVFALPEGPLVERSPSEVMAEYNRRYDRPPNPNSAAAELDHSYQAHRAQP